MYISADAAKEACAFDHIIKTYILIDIQELGRDFKVWYKIIHECYQHVCQNVV